MYSGEEPIIACVFEKVINAFLFKTYFALCTANYLQKVSQLIRLFFFSILPMRAFISSTDCSGDWECFLRDCGASNLYFISTF